MDARHPGSDDDLPDEDLPVLTRAQARRLRVLLRQAMAERGCEVAVSGGHLTDLRGSTYGLRNIAIRLRDHPRGEQGWPEVIDGYADHLMNLQAGEPAQRVAAMTVEEARRHVYPMLCPADVPLASYRTTPQLAPGLLEMLALDLPDNVMYLNDDKVAELGGREVLREAALANLRALPPPATRRLGGPDRYADLIGNPSHYAASWLLVLPDLLSQVLGTTAPYGALVAAPARHWALVHVLRDKTALPSLQMMTGLAEGIYNEEAGRISPDVFWLRDGTWTPLIARDTSDGKPVVRIGPQLAAVLRELGVLPP